MLTSPNSQSKKRKLLTLMLLPWIAGCGKTAKADPTRDPQQRFKGIGVILVVDAVIGAEMDQVVICDDRGVEIYGSAAVSRKIRGIESPRLS